VNRGAHRAAHAVELTTSAASVILGSNVTLTATVPSGGLRTPTGSVNFLDTAVHLGAISLDGLGSATVTAALTAGVHQVEAIYSGDGNFEPSAALVSVKVVVPGYTIVPDPAALTVKLGQAAKSTITITPVGGFKGQLSLVCGETPQIATCSLSPTTVVLPGDDLPHTVQFTLKTTVIAGSASAVPAGGTGYAVAALMLSPFGWVAVVSLAGRRRNLVLERRGGECRGYFGGGNGDHADVWFSDGAVGSDRLRKRTYGAVWKVDDHDAGDRGRGASYREYYFDDNAVGHLRGGEDRRAHVGFLARMCRFQNLGELRSLDGGGRPPSRG